MPENSRIESLEENTDRVVIWSHRLMDRGRLDEVIRITRAQGLPPEDTERL